MTPLQNAKKIAKELKEEQMKEMTALFKTVDTVKQQEVAESNFIFLLHYLM